MEAEESDFKLCDESLCQSEFSDSDSDQESELQGMVPTVLSQSVSMPAELQLTFPNASCVGPTMDMGQQIMLVSSDGNVVKFPANLGSKPITNELGEPSAKRLCIEQDGQTFILTGLSINPNLTQSLMPANELVSSQLLGETSKETDINQAWFTSREDKTTLQRKGHLWKQGMWSREEIDLLQDNIQLYCQEHDITDPATVIFQMSKDERKDFYRTVAKGLNRPLFSVYRRVIRMYDNKNHIGKYTDEELEQLKELRSIHGNDWQAIGAAMGRSASSIKDRCRLLKENCNQGKWLPIEERQLAEAVYDLAKVVPGEMISSGLSWAAVAERVGTRSEKQCRTKWLNFLNWKEAGGTIWSREDDIALICKVCSLNVSEETLIDWNEMSKNWTSVRSPQWLRGKFWALKRHCPKEALNSFPEMCDYLYKHYAQKVCIKDEKSGGNLVSAVTMVQQVKPIPTCTPTIVSIPTRPLLTRPTLTTPTHFINSIGTPLTSAPPTNPVVGDLSSLLGSTATLGMTPTVIQTVGVLPQSLQPNPNALTPEQAFLLTHTGQTTLPMTAAVGTGQIIIQTVGDNLQMTEAIGLQLRANPQIILGSLVSTPGCPESLVMPLNSNSGSISLDDEKDDDLNDDDDRAYSDESFQHVESYDDDDASHIESDFVDDKGNRLIVSDVMLAASGSSSDIDKDSMDHVKSPSSS